MVIETLRQLKEFCESLDDCREICVDTEFLGEGRYYPELGIIQVAADGHAVLVDPHAITDLSPLVPILTRGTTEKIVHAGLSDLRILFRSLGHAISPVFDTQIAAALLGYGDQLSLKNLVHQVLGIQLDKQERYTDWSRRPLSTAQVDYALNDVRWLGELRDKLTASLISQSRLDWAKGEFRLLEDAQSVWGDDPVEVASKTRGAGQLDRGQMARLVELISWRDKVAEQLNLPVGRVARDEVLFELARRPRNSLRQLGEIRGFTYRQVEQFGEDLVKVLRRSPSSADQARGEAALLAIAARTPPTPDLELKADFLELCLNVVAQESAVARRMLATRNDLLALATRGDEAPVQLLQGWRRGLAGDKLLAALAGRAEVRVDADTRRVVVNWLTGTQVSQTTKD
ncbi:MAG: ribonuclease D [Terriglobia bacterium]|jgi:ribonuclease D